MPIGQDGSYRVLSLAEGLNDQANPLLIGEGQASDLRNIELNRRSLEEARGIQRLNEDRPRPGGVRLGPVNRLDSVQGMAGRWGHGYAFAPCTVVLREEPTAIEVAVRLEKDSVLPETGEGTGARFHQGLSGRATASGTRLPGGEHQFFPAIARGAREVERPSWALGLGIVAPEGLRSAAGAVVGEPDRLVPVFAWWDAAEERLRVTAADFTCHPHVDYQVSIVFGVGWYVNGVAMPVLAGYAAVPAPQPAGASSRLPIYFGRCFQAEPGVSYARVDRKHAFMGRRGLTVTGVAGPALTIANQQMAFAAATASSYVGYRVRVRTGADAGRIYDVASNTTPTVETTFGVAVSFAGHGILAGDTVDLVPPVEPIAADATIQEARLWAMAPSAATVAALALRQAVVDPKDPSAVGSLLAAVAKRPMADLIAYWPLSDDGGNVCRELARGSDAFFAPSLVTVGPGGGPASPRALWLDGESQGLQFRFGDDPNMPRNYAWNLGKDAAGLKHWNVCVRLAFCLGGDVEGNGAGAVQEHVYQVLASVGIPGSRVALEARVATFGATNVIYFLLPDGTFATVPLLTPLQPGVWYNAILGIDALLDSAPNPNRHRVYFQAVDGALVPFGGFSAPFDLDAAPMDASADVVVAVGASVNGAQDLGAGAHNHAMVGLACAGVGFHPAHSDPGTTTNNILPLVHFDAISTLEELRPAISGIGAGVTIGAGSRSVVFPAEAPPPAFIRRWPIAVELEGLELREVGRPTRLFPDWGVVDVVSGATATLIVPQLGAAAGGTARAQLWAAYTDFQASEPPEDIELSAAPGAGPDPWAETKKVFADLAESANGVSMALLPLLPYVSPVRVAPCWGCGIVDRAAIPIRSLSHYKRADDREALMLVAAGSVFEVDTRWRRGSPWSDSDRCFEFRRIGPQQRRALEELNGGSTLFSAASRPLPGEAVRLPGAAVAIGGSFATRKARQIEADIWLPDMDGRRTIAARARLIHGIDGTGARRLLWQKNFHFWVDNGNLALEIRDDATLFLWRATLHLVGSQALRPQTWHRVAVEIRGDVVAAVETITGADFYIDGRAAGTASVSAATALSNVPQLPATVPTYLGAIGEEGGVAFYDGLGGRMRGFAFADDYQYGAAGGVGLEYEPAEIAATATAPRIVSVPMDEGEGFVFATNGEDARFVGRHCVHVGSGVGAEGAPVSAVTFGDVWYMAHPRTRPWRYDFEAFTRAGLKAPVGELGAVAVARAPLRILSGGADVPGAIGAANRSSVAVAAPHLAVFAGAAPSPAQADLGALVFVPSDPDMGPAGDQGPGYIGVVDAATAGYSVLPAPFASQAAAAADLAWMLFRAAKTTDATRVATSYKNAIRALASSTPWGSRRLLPSGADDCDTPRIEDRVAAPPNAACIQFHGNHYVELPPYVIPADPVGQGKVFSWKGYVWLAEEGVYGDDDQVIFERATDADSGSWRIVVFGGGRVRFEFFDVGIGAFRSIATVGTVISPKQWHYVHVRYRYKDSGACVFDPRGGWEPDLRWHWKTAAAGQAQKDRQYRDGLWVYACEGLHQRGGVHADVAAGYDGDVDDGARCALMTLPGSQCQVGGTLAPTAALTNNHSQQLLNCGLHRGAPFLTPERGDVLFPSPASAGTDSGIVLTVLANAFAAVAAGIGAGQVQLPAGFALPRTCSMNRDDAWNREADQPVTASSAIFHIPSAGAGSRYNYLNDVAAVDPASVVQTPSLATPGLASGDVYGKSDAWAVLVRVWSVVNPNGTPGVLAGDAVDKAAADAARVLAIVHLGTNDIGAAARGGVGGHTMFLTDDTLFGGDGMGALLSGGNTLLAGSTVHATIELPNGANQARSSANRLVFPGLVEHGENPVGAQDAPDTSLAPVRIGGTVGQGKDGRALRGLRGRLDDVAWLLAVAQASGTAIYTTDCLVPDAFFTGPADTRIQSLPRLHAATNALVQDDQGNAWSGTPAARATGSFRFDETSGDAVVKVGADSAAEVTVGSIAVDADGLQDAGRHTFRVSFYDPVQGVESDLGPETAVDLAGENGAGDLLEGQATFMLQGIPVSGDRRRGLGRRIYKTFADGAVPLLFGELRDNSSTSLTPRPSLARLATAAAASFERQRPPLAAAMIATESNMAFGGLDDAPNVMVLSQPFRPEEVRGTRIVFAESGRGGGIVALGVIKGLIVAAKRNALFVVTPAGDAFRIQRVNSDVGCIAHGSMATKDDILYWIGQKGVYVFPGNARAYSVSDAIEDLYRRKLDLGSMAGAYGVAYYERGQYLVTAHLLGDAHPMALLSAERRFDQFGNPYEAWSLLRPGVPARALAAFEDLEGLSRAMVGSAGYAFVHDRGDHVGSAGVVYSDGTVVEVRDARTVRAAFAEPRRGAGAAGLPVLVVVERRKGKVLAAHARGDSFEVLLESWVAHAVENIDGTVTLHLADGVATEAARGRRIVLGGHLFSWTSQEVDLGLHETVKAWDFLDLAFTPVPGASAFVEILAGSGAVAFAGQFPLDNGEFSVPLNAVHLRRIRYRISGYGRRRGLVVHRAALRGRPEAYGRRERGHAG